jgi:Rap1a immunity proteins
MRTPLWIKTLASIGAACALLSTAGFSAAQNADLVTPTAGEWQRNCDAYVRAVQGEEGTSDLDVTWCLGMTSGMLNGLRLGSQLGALNMASRMTVTYGLQSRDVFEVFQQQTPESLLQVCVPKGIKMREYIETVHKYIGKTADVTERPLNEVFFEALQERFVCDSPRTDAAPLPEKAPPPAPRPRRKP